MKKRITLIIMSVFLMGAISDARPFQVAVIDSGFGFDVEFNKAPFKICKKGSYDFITKKHKVGDDMIGHGTIVTALINQRAKTKDICFLIYRVFGSSGEGENKDIDDAILRAIRARADVINMSIGNRTHSNRTNNLLRIANKRGIKVFIAAGNAGDNLNNTCNSYPSCYRGLFPNVVIVGALDARLNVEKYSNRGSFITVYKYGRTRNGARGTSFAAPRAAGDYIITRIG